MTPILLLQIFGWRIGLTSMYKYIEDVVMAGSMARTDTPFILSSQGWPCRNGEVRVASDLKSFVLDSFYSFSGWRSFSSSYQL